MLKRSWLLLILSVLLFLPTVSAFTFFPPLNASSAGSLFSGVFTPNSSDVPVYAAFFALVMIMIFYQALRRTMLAGGAASIAIIFGAITFFLLFTQPQYITILLGTFVGALLMSAFLAVLIIPSRNGAPLSKMLGAVVLLILLYLIIANNSSIGTALNNLLHFNFVGVLPVIIIAAIVLVIIIMLIRVFRTTQHRGLRMFIPIIILGLLIFFFVPGAGAFLLSPLSLIFYGLLFIVLIWWFFFHSPKMPSYIPDREPSSKTPNPPPVPPAVPQRPTPPPAKSPPPKPTPPTPPPQPQTKGKYQWEGTVPMSSIKTHEVVFHHVNEKYNEKKGKFKKESSFEEGEDRDRFVEQNKEHLGFWRKQKKPKNP